jgi:hypothetical protein
LQWDLQHIQPVSAMLQIFATLPVATATGGKSFSALKYLKDYLRSTMIEDRLNDLAHYLYMNRDIELARLLKSLERVIDAWRLYEPIRKKALKLQHY